ncbi:hypothetical protein NIES4072_53310 [Nostoc commune NIES-4072]|uniref:Uncharacterized protein n=1 Tax=Nostoc commune NIES-4072 TaxID=2005467 RepID=A0A2R5FZH3_NOSCO|nr:hypothetical protein NIES4070_37640 [Nostoc commune HK-02]GBG21643.1 hypothetical protein NIES4072_53310 [Nostoc commune NIES-4072]
MLYIILEFSRVLSSTSIVCSVSSTQPLGYVPSTVVNIFNLTACE